MRHALTPGQALRQSGTKHHMGCATAIAGCVSMGPAPHRTTISVKPRHMRAINSDFFAS